MYESKTYRRSGVEVRPAMHRQLATVPNASRLRPERPRQIRALTARLSESVSDSCSIRACDSQAVRAASNPRPLCRAYPQVAQLFNDRIGQDAASALRPGQTAPASRGLLAEQPQLLAGPVREPAVRTPLPAAELAVLLPLLAAEHLPERGVQTPLPVDGPVPELAVPLPPRDPWLPLFLVRSSRWPSHRRWVETRGAPRSILRWASNLLPRSRARTVTPWRVRSIRGGSSDAFGEGAFVFVGALEK
jgi:hypothetical protein